MDVGKKAGPVQDLYRLLVRGISEICALYVFSQVDNYWGNTPGNIDPSDSVKKLTVQPMMTMLRKYPHSSLGKRVSDTHMVIVFYVIAYSSLPRGAITKLDKPCTEN